jgi:hypothetical protein
MWRAGPSIDALEIQLVRRRRRSERVVTMKRILFWSAGSLSGLLILFSCGGDSGTSPNNTPPVGSVAPTATPAPAPTATPGPRATPAPATPEIPAAAEDDNPGPAVTVRNRVFYVSDKPLNQGGEIRCGADITRPCYEEASNHDVMRRGEFAIFDTTPLNAAGQKCCRDATVVWSFENGGVFDHVVGSNKFQYRVYGRAVGVAQVRARVDGIDGVPILNVEVR